MGGIKGKLIAIVITLEIMKKLLILSLIFIGQFTFAQDDGQSDLEKLLGKAQEVLRQVELPDLKKEINTEWVIVASSFHMSR